MTQSRRFINSAAIERGREGERYLYEQLSARLDATGLNVMLRAEEQCR